MRPLVILRPEPGASSTARAAEALGLQPLVLPLFEVRALEWHVPQPADFDALLLTSANAVRHGGAGLDAVRLLPAWCVGQATAEAARDGGFSVVAVGSAGVDSLLASAPRSARLLHLCGAHWRQPRESVHSIVDIPVYEAVELPRPHRFEELEGAVVAIHSARAGSALAQHASEIGLARHTTAIAAISAEAAAAAGAGWEAVEFPEEPSEAALLAIAARLCHNAA